MIKKLLLIIALLFPVISFGATLDIVLPDYNIEVGDNFEVDIILDTEGSKTEGVGIRYLNFDPSYLRVNDSIYDESGVQIKPGELYGSLRSNNVSNNDGRIEFVQITNGTKYFDGKGLLATISFKALKSGNPSLYFDYIFGSTIDTNIASNGEDVLKSPSYKRVSIGSTENYCSESGIEFTCQSSPCSSYSYCSIPDCECSCDTGYCCTGSCSEKEDSLVVELRKRITDIVARISYLQKLLAEMETETISYTIPNNFIFKKTLTLGDRNIDVYYLQIFLKNQGKEIYPSGIVSGYFGLLTQSAIVRFQKKYATEVLYPWKIYYPTGVVGRTTRIKINELIGK